MHGLWANKQNVERTKHKHKEAHQSAAHMALHWTFSSTVNVVKSIAGLHIPLYVKGATQSLPTPTHACSKQHDAQIAYNQKIQQAWPGRLTHTDSYAQQIELLEFAFENIMLILFGRTFRFSIVHQNQLWESETWPLQTKPTSILVHQNQNWKCNLVTWSMQTKPNHASLVVSKLKCAPPDNGQKFSYKLLCKAMRPGISTRTTLCLQLSLCRWMLCRHNAHHNREVACKPPSKQEASS